MKLVNKLSIAGQPFTLVDRDVRLSLSTPARANFTVMGTPPTQGLVEYAFGYSSMGPVQDFFLGYVERVTPIDSKHSKVFCRELSASLAVDLPLSLRNVTMKDVLAKVTETMGLTFNIPNAAYADVKAANFINLGSGYLVMDTLAQVYQIPNFIWQQQTNGKIYAGSWDDSHWHNKIAVIPTSFLSRQLSNQSAQIAPIPTLRPGAELNDNRVTDVRLQSNAMVITWKPQ